MGQYKPKNVDCKKYKPLAEELCRRCGSPINAAEYSGVGVSSLYRIRHEYNCTIQRATAAKIVHALKRKREEDRVTGSVHPAMIKARKTQKKIEDKMDRLIGY